MLSTSVEKRPKQNLQKRSSCRINIVTSTSSLLLLPCHLVATGRTRTRNYSQRSYAQWLNKWLHSKGHRAKHLCGHRSHKSSTTWTFQIQKRELMMKYMKIVSLWITKDCKAQFGHGGFVKILSHPLVLGPISNLIILTATADRNPLEVVFRC